MLGFNCVTIFRGRILLHSVLYSALIHETLCKCSLAMLLRKGIFSGSSFHPGSILSLIKGLEKAVSNHLVLLKMKDFWIQRSSSGSKYYLSLVRLIIHKAATTYRVAITGKVLCLRLWGEWTYLVNQKLEFWVSQEITVAGSNSRGSQGDGVGVPQIREFTGILITSGEHCWRQFKCGLLAWGVCCMGDRKSWLSFDSHPSLCSWKQSLRYLGARTNFVFIVVISFYRE